MNYQCLYVVSARTAASASVIFMMMIINGDDGTRALKEDFKDGEIYFDYNYRHAFLIPGLKMEPGTHG